MSVMAIVAPLGENVRPVAATFQTVPVLVSVQAPVIVRAHVVVPVELNEVVVTACPPSLKVPDVSVRPVPWKES
jgi:hypothetical protein